MTQEAEHAKNHGNQLLARQPAATARSFANHIERQGLTQSTVYPGACGWCQAKAGGKLRTYAA